MEQELVVVISQRRVDVSSVGIPVRLVNDLLQFVRSFIDGFRLSAWWCV